MTYVVMFVRVKHTDATRGISGDVYHISTVLFYRYANHICVSYTTRTNYGDECDFAIDYTYAIYI
jgi:hypothetical protein